MTKYIKKQNQARKTSRNIKKSRRRSNKKTSHAVIIKR